MSVSTVSRMKALDAVNDSRYLRQNLKRGAVFLETLCRDAASELKRALPISCLRTAPGIPVHVGALLESHRYRSYHWDAALSLCLRAQCI